MNPFRYDWEVVGTIAYAIGVLVFIVAVIGYAAGRMNEPRAGDACGVGNHWRETPANSALGSDLSCEPD